MRARVQVLVRVFKLGFCLSSAGRGRGVLLTRFGYEFWSGARHCWPWPEACVFGYVFLRHSGPGFGAVAGLSPIPTLDPPG